MLPVCTGVYGSHFIIPLEHLCSISSNQLGKTGSAVHTLLEKLPSLQTIVLVLYVYTKSACTVNLEIFAVKIFSLSSLATKIKHAKFKRMRIL